MRGTIENISILGRECSLYLPKEYHISDKYYPVVYVNGYDIDEDIMEDIESHFRGQCNECILLSIKSEDWNVEFSPWPAPALTKKSEAFGGGGEEYLNFLTNNIKPFVDNNYKTKPEPSNTTLMGYSLGGLVALYALYTTEVFGKIGSLSGSLWYDGWIEFISSHTPTNLQARVYISLGRGEERSRNQRMAKVGDCTRETASILEKQLKAKENIILEWNEGGHFTETPKRFKKSLLWLMAD